MLPSPNSCGICVEGERRVLKEGEVTIFDDSKVGIIQQRRMNDVLLYKMSLQYHRCSGTYCAIISLHVNHYYG